MNIVNALKGSKTYIIGGLMILYGILGWSLKQVVPSQAVYDIGLGLTAMTIRASISTAIMTILDKLATIQTPPTTPTDTTSKMENV